jgi:hypothetical protein
MADQMLPLLQSMEKTMASMSQLLQASLAQKPTYKQDVQHNTHLEVPPQQQWHPMDPEKRKNDVDPIHKRVAEIKQSVRSAHPICLRCGDKGHIA